MRLLWAIVLSAWAIAVHAQPALRALTLADALAAAERANPELLAARAALAAAEGESRDAAAFFYRNPEFSVEQTRRRGMGADGVGMRFLRESGFGLAQPLEIAGQPGHRREAARRALAAVRAEILDAQVRVRADVEAAFARVLLLQRRLASEDQNMKLAEEAAAAVGKRVDAGEDSRLDGNLARVEAERARNQVSTVREQLIEARARLAALVQLVPSQFPEAVGELPERIPGYRLEDLLLRAAERPELRALSEREAAAESRLRLERASVFPDVTVGLTSAREGAPEIRERLTTLSVTLPLPLFNRNRSGIGRATTARDLAQIERRAALRNGEAAIRELWRRLASLEARLSRLANAVLPKLDENFNLSTKAYRAGEIGILQLVLVNRQALDARRDFLEALGEFTQARIALEQAVGVHRLEPLAAGPSPNFPISKP